MHIYLSLKQILLNQIAVLIRQKYDKPDDDQERLNRRLRYLQTALEQIKSYDHNENFRFVIRHFNVELNENEQQQQRKLSAKFDDDNTNKRNSKSGFTTTRSETLFTGAEAEQYDNYFGTDSDNDDNKYNDKNNKNKPNINTPHSQQRDRYNDGSQWIHFRGFARWLKKQSFIKLKNKKDQQKLKRIWNTICGLHTIRGWQNGNIGSQNIIGAYGTSRPYIAIYKCGTKEIVKASLLRISVTQNRIFKFNLERDFIDKYAQRTARRSIDLENEDYNTALEPTANELVKGRNLFNLVLNKDILRICATMLWDTNLANNVLEELLHNPRFSMYGIHAKKLADTLAKEMQLGSLQMTPSYEETPNYVEQKQQQKKYNNSNSTSNSNNNGTVEQFALPSPQRPVSMQQHKQNNIKQKSNNYDNSNNHNNNHQGQIYNDQYNNQYSKQQPAQNNNNNNYSNYYNNNQQQQPPQQQMTEHEQYYHDQKQKQKQAKPDPIPEEEDEPQDYVNDDDEDTKPGHRAQNLSVVQHDMPMDHIRDSEINDYGGGRYGDDENDSEDEDDSSVDDEPYQQHH